MNIELRMIAAGILSLCLSGCIPIRTPTVTSGPKSFKGDLSFIQDGSTTRQEIEGRLGWADAYVHDPRLFLGHWGSSSTYLVTLVAGAEREWGGRTVMIEFDDAGRVQAHRVVDDPHLMKELAAWMERVHYPAFDLRRPVEVEGWKDGEPVTWRFSTNVIQGPPNPYPPYSPFCYCLEKLRVISEAENGRYKLASAGSVLDLDGDGMIKVVRFLQQTGNLRSTH